MKHQSKILIIEDDPTTALLYSGSLRPFGYEIVVFYGIKPALETFKEEGYKSIDLIVTDLLLPDGTGIELIQEVRKSSSNIPIIVVSSAEDSQSIIDVMKENVQDYCIKPIATKELVKKIEYHLSKQEMDYQKTIFEKEKIISLEKLLDWYSFKNRSMAMGEFDTQELHKNLFHILRASLSQGAGFGILVQIIDIIKGMTKTESGDYILQKEVLSILEENASYAKKVLDTFSEIENIIFDRVTSEVIGTKSFLEEFQIIVTSLHPLLKIKNQRIQLGNLEERFSEKTKLNWNRELFGKVFSELLVNAMKFSPESSAIFIMFQSDSEYLSVSIVNSVAGDLKMGVGIPNEYLDLVFEPFFRLTKNLYEKHESLDFGIGLSLVRETIQKFGGTVVVKNINDHLGEVVLPKVEFKVTLPYSSSEK
ncbi:response regulator [Leptospira sp. 85282-16]|uniref:Response regulator n=1 Tax=Leptospira montravelensis TaxID=2484961 RepID=A0ABY2LWH3_9LEPT|nr:MULTISPECIES: response regulator [Leptospira]MCT8332858.1 response regulator [Leptospira sp. 85282-16]TGK84043.1 response regulator [Leptospira montravelensis]TGL06051.1 response regulator [Leptospira montravelensis]